MHKPAAKVKHATAVDVPSQKRCCGGVLSAAECGSVAVEIGRCQSCAVQCGLIMTEKEMGAHSTNPKAQEQSATPAARTAACGCGRPCLPLLVVADLCLPFVILAKKQCSKARALMKSLHPVCLTWWSKLLCS